MEIRLFETSFGSSMADGKEDPLGAVATSWPHCTVIKDWSTSLKRNRVLSETVST
jgi:hypothetical protein